MPGPGNRLRAMSFPLTFPKLVWDDLASDELESGKDANSTGTREEEDLSGDDELLDEDCDHVVEHVDAEEDRKPYNEHQY